MIVIPEWFPAHPPIYDIHQSYAGNFADGPFFNGAIPQRPKKVNSIDFLDCSLYSPIGIPAGPLLNARWIKLAAALGFDLLTYKTIRSVAHPGHPLPNMIFVDPRGHNMAHVSAQAEHFDELTLTNSFGMPSQSIEFLMEDIDRALSYLGKGQAMIVSIVGSTGAGGSLAQDFVRTALIAREAGARFIEANFSCPNVAQSEGMLYLDPEGVFAIAQAIVHAINPVPLILKVGLFPSGEVFEQVLVSAARAGVRAICGINSVSMQVVDDAGQPALSASRAKSGVCGAAIRQFAMQWIREAASIIRRRKLDLTLMGCGGFMRPEHLDDCLDAGAAIAMSATAMMWDPYLALRTHWSHIYE
jgi:dihydroorotate dehydrogenase (NAD+) catalytic subunit